MKFFVNFLHSTWLSGPSGTWPRCDAEIVHVALHVGTRGISKSTRRVVRLGIHLLTGFSAK